MQELNGTTVTEKADAEPKVDLNADLDINGQDKNNKTVEINA